MPPAQNVTVQVGHAFAAIAAVVDHETVAILRQPDLLRDFRRFQQQVSEQLLILRLCLADALDGLAGNDEDMRGGLRADVTESDDLVILIDDIRRDLAGGDLLEKRLAHVETISASTPGCQRFRICFRQKSLTLRA
jgi:hypothetical protein